MLLVLDNFEHRLPAADNLVDLLRSCPAVKLLVTSREPLDLQAEWLFEVDGLDYPVQVESVAEDYGCVKLFVDRAQQVKSGFALDASSAACVARICQMVQGMPLALELAAAQLRHADCGHIAAQLESSLDVLETSMRDVPERHRSLRAMFDESWRSLSDQERAVLAGLSVFRGGFDAAAVAGANARQLGSLVDRCLVRRTADGRLDLHELIRQFAGSKLEHGLVESTHTQVVRARHVAHYLALAAAA